MKYLLMIYHDERRWKELSDAEIQQMYGEFGKLREELQSNGRFLARRCAVTANDYRDECTDS